LFIFRFPSQAAKGGREFFQGAAPSVVRKVCLILEDGRDILVAPAKRLIVVQQPQTGNEIASVLTSWTSAERAGDNTTTTTIIIIQKKRIHNNNKNRLMETNTPQQPPPPPR